MTFFGRIASVLLTFVAACGSPQPSATPEPTEPATESAAARPCTGPNVVDAATTDQLTTALSGATPGTVIRLAPGTYTGSFVARTPATAAAPIVLCGPRTAVLDGGAADKSYTLHLDGASHWQVSGLSVRGGQKGIMLDAVQGALLDDLLVEGTGDEAIHLRRGTTDTTVRDSEIRDTGKRRAKFGEGVYVGTAESNWCETTGCQPDRSDRNSIIHNTISDTTAESIDVKEGTTGGLIRGNTFSGTGMTKADAWVNLKGNSWTVAANDGSDAPEDGFQVHEIVDGWGLDNVFTGNTAAVNSTGYLVNVTRNGERNTVSCTNTATAAGRGVSSVPCVP